MQPRSPVMALIPVATILLTGTPGSASDQPWNLNGTWELNSPVFFYNAADGTCTVLADPPYKGMHPITQVGNQLMIGGFPGSGTLSGNSLQYTVTAQPRRQVSGQITQDINPTRGTIITRITGTAVCEGQAKTQFTLTRTVPMQPVNPSTDPTKRPGSGQAADPMQPITIAIPVGAATTFRITDADETAVVSINGKPVLMAKWNGQPGTAAAAIPLKPGVYDLTFAITSNRPSCSGLFTLSVGDQPLIANPIGYPRGTLRQQRLFNCFFKSTKLTVKAAN